ncbi:probable enoyl-CoA hydratase [Octopus vulgaris]|uniref:Probable enoyl-CoA hydratase n=1 Tax=Octopus vulgaris TaxID=6645 RepID=A0AA36FJ58_OCTVU|nr:probable enoyl-CoA hydratase [Octopus vulgaris]
MTLPFGPLGLRCLSRSVLCGRNVKTVFLQQTTSAGRFVHNIAKKDSVTVELIGKICLIGLNCPEKKNAVNSQTAHSLYRAFQDFEHNDQTHVAVLFGKGGNFCAGFDLKELADEFRSAEVALPDSPSRTERAPMGPTRMSFSKPVIAAVSGYAVAGGLELALMCDLRVVEESAIMGVYNRRLAIGQATQLALSISRYPQVCLQADRRSAYYSCYDATSRQEALQYEFLNGRDVLTVESIKGAQKFVEGYGKHGAFDTENKDK